MAVEEKSSMLSSASNTVFSFVALYFTTLFSMDTWDAARSSPHRAPGSNTYFRPANRPSEYQSNYNAAGHRGGAGNGDLGRRETGRVPTARDSRPAMRMGASAGCGACAM
ncbi:hypothetical protein EJ04DRAFT_573831 [Polyplosphaeria fusca]|uniref:Uncharacterized protein n=1 Tax=Polyplosphaeria fusca TaxID=682080 RepID=A0A9P4R7J0_9PLEO|nr:hypothetical protein EJ04DRAFT_573831 [Polyplosphaeria fusca]